MRLTQTIRETDLLAELSRQGVRVWVDGAHLRIRAPKGVLTPALRAHLAQRKAALINRLRANESSQTPQVWLDNQVIEEDGALILHWDAVEDLFPEGLLNEMFGALAAGATVVIPELTATRDPALLSKIIRDERVTIWNSVPALMEMVVGYAEARGENLPESLRLVMLSGDWIPVNLPRRIESLSKKVRVVSLGGATEASIWSIVEPVQKFHPLDLIAFLQSC